MSKEYLSQEETREIARKKNAMDEGLVLSVMEMEAFQEHSSRIFKLALAALSDIVGEKVRLGEVEIDWMSSGEMMTFIDAEKAVTLMELVKPVEGHNLLALGIREASALSDIVMGVDGAIGDEEFSERSIQVYREIAEKAAAAITGALQDSWDGITELGTVKTWFGDMEQEKDLKAMVSAGRVCILRCPFALEGKIQGEMAQIYSAKLVKDMAALWIQRGSWQQKVQEEEKEIRVERPVFPPLVERDEKSQARNLDLIMDVPLEFSVVLGRTKKTIKEVLSLGTGSIVSLNKLADEPLEILVNGKLIAHGEVVVINENFGIRITNILSREKRVQGLK